MQKLLSKEVGKLSKLVLKNIRGAFKKFLAPENWPYWVGALVIILLVVLAVYLIKRRRAGKQQDESAALEPEKQAQAQQKQEAAQKVFPKSTLADIWKAFIKGIPAEFRRSIALYEHFVVLGEAGAGKSLLIDNCTDWQGQARQFYPSYTLNPLLQLYLGSRMLIQELPVALLSDTAQQIRAALLKLWKPLFRKKPPKVIVVLNAEDLKDESPDALKRQAQMMRGKINLLSARRGKPVPLYIALTHMDRFEGFSEFFDFLRSHSIPLELEIGERGAGELQACLEPYEAYLMTALTTLPAEDYLKMISFFRRAPEIFEILADFIAVLKSSEALSSAPRIVGLYLTSQREKDREVSNPFHSTLSYRDIQKFNPLLKHQLAAGFLLFFGLGYLWFGYRYEHALMIETGRELQAVESYPPHPDRYEEEMHRLFLDFSFNLKSYPLLSVLPDYFPQTDQIIHRRLLNNIREFYLLPEFERIGADPDGFGVYDKPLYLLALLYSSRENGLGRLIAENLEQWAAKLELPEILIEDYIKESAAAWKTVLKVPDWICNRVLDKPTDTQPWLVFFNAVEKSIDRPFLTQAYLQNLQQKAEGLLQILEESERHDFSREIYGLLRRESPLKIKADWAGQIRGARLKQTAIRDFLTFFMEKDIVFPRVDGLSFGQFLDNLKAMMAESEEKERRFAFYLGRKDFAITAREVNGLINRSRMTLFMREFMERSSWNGGLLFFGEDALFPDIVLNPNSNGSLFFSDNGRIDGRFTRKAFEEEIKPALLELPDFLNRLPIARDEKARFSNFIVRGMESYSKRYVFGYYHYYDSFHVKADFLTALRYVLTHMQMPSSQFEEFLLVIKNNTALELEDSPFLHPFAAKLKEFDFFRRLMGEDNGSYPELEKYKFIMAQLQADIENIQPFVADNDADAAAALKSRLSSLGRICLAEFCNQDDSYLALVKMWMNSIGAEAKWQRLFMEPVLRSYALGKTEVEGVILKSWQALWDSNVQPVFDKFPFDMSADAMVDPEWLEAAIHPEGSFWKSFDSLIAPVCVKRGRVWEEKASPLGALQLPQNMLKTVNGMEYLKTALWDDKGAPRPLVFSVRPQLLPRKRVDETVAVLSFLHSGKSSVFGFNQQPAWSRLEIEWWERQTAAVGLEFAKPFDKRKSYRKITVPSSTWSFHRLLRKAQLLEDRTAVWELKAASDQEEPLAVQFSIQPDPWGLFVAAPPAPRISCNQP